MEDLHLGCIGLMLKIPVCEVWHLFSCCNEIFVSIESRCIFLMAHSSFFCNVIGVGCVLITFPHIRLYITDFPKAVKRLLKNDILMFRTASSVLHILPIAGLYTFLPKYLESQFRLAAHSAAMISGTIVSFLFILADPMPHIFRYYDIILIFSYFDICFCSE